MDPNYEGGGVGEYKYYNETSGQYKCYSGKCRAKMDCHSSRSETWVLLGIFKIDSISQGDGWMEQLPQNHTLGHWNWGNYYSSVSAIRDKLPDGCTKTKYKANGNYLYMDIKPEKNARVDLALYTDSICTILYTGNTNDFDVYELSGTSYSEMTTFNNLLNGYKICQPCVAYNLAYNMAANHSKHFYFSNHSNHFYFNKKRNYTLYTKFNQV